MSPIARTVALCLLFVAIVLVMLYHSVTRVPTLDEDQLRELGGFVRIDMESSAYTQRTLDFFANRLFDRWGKHTGVVIQSCLRRSDRDIDRLIEMKARVRLCKGAYLEPPDVAFPDKADVDQSYLMLMERLMERGNYPGLATHDARIGRERRYDTLSY